MRCAADMFHHLFDGLSFSQRAICMREMGLFAVFLPLPLHLALSNISIHADDNYLKIQFSNTAIVVKPNPPTNYYVIGGTYIGY